MIHIEVSDSIDSGTIDETALRQAAELVFQHESVSKDSAVTVLITSDAQIRALNRRYRGIDAPTDVLSFNVDISDPDDGMQYLGDVVISLPTARAQAASNGNTITAELQLLVVHGLLHILGFDHAEHEEKAVMWHKQAEILAGLGLGGISLPG